MSFRLSAFGCGKQLLVSFGVALNIGLMIMLWIMLRFCLIRMSLILWEDGKRQCKNAHERKRSELTNTHCFASVEIVEL